MRAPGLKRFIPSLALDAIARSFWILPALAMVVGGGLGFLMPFLGDATEGSWGFFAGSDAEGARTLLQTIATATVSVAGIAFSVTVIAFQLASQQLGPRVLRTFQTDRLNQATLAIFLGLFVYALVAIARQSATGSPPNLSLSVAVVLAIFAFALFAAFIHNVVLSLQASTIIRRMAADARSLMASPFPAGLGKGPEDEDAARRDFERRMSGGRRAFVKSPRAGYLNAIDGERLIVLAEGCNGIVSQRQAIGDFTLTGEVLAEVWLAEGDPSGFAARVSDVFDLGTERTLVQDVGFPIRQLADVALRGLSPSLNDPTTAENAMGSLADALVVFADHDPVPHLRLDGSGTPRFAACAPGLDDLVRLGFEQVRVSAAAHPVIGRRLLYLLAEVRRSAMDSGSSTEEIERQAQLLEEAVASEAKTADDVREIGDASRRFDEKAATTKRSNR